MVISINEERRSFSGLDRCTVEMWSAHESVVNLEIILSPIYIKTISSPILVCQDS